MKHDNIVGFFGLMTGVFAVLVIVTGNDACVIVGFLTATLTLGFAADVA